jgi:hypothetical protein
MRAVVIDSVQARIVDKDWNLEAWEDVAIYGNEEGKLLGLPANPVAHVVVGELMPGDFIVGTVVVLGFDETTGEEQDIPQHVLDALNLVPSVRST